MSKKKIEYFEIKSPIKKRIDDFISSILKKQEEEINDILKKIYSEYGNVLIKVEISPKKDHQLNDKTIIFPIPKQPFSIKILNKITSKNKNQSQKQKIFRVKWLLEKYKEIHE